MHQISRQVRNAAENVFGMIAYLNLPVSEPILTTVNHFKFISYTIFSTKTLEEIFKTLQLFSRRLFEKSVLAKQF